MSTLRYILSFGFIALSIALLGQDISFIASAPASVSVGRQFEYTLKGNKQGNVQLPSSGDFEVLGGPFTSYSSSTQWVNGKMKAETTASYTYIFRGRKTGDFT
ncbi:MAG: BatD family protein, partial [Bacteroidales bacterium]|nr:BatD family protein [Bacteroidales bacterium]